MADVWVSDHTVHPAAQDYPSPYLYDPLLSLAWAGAATQRVGLGTSVLVVPTHNPLGLANSLASLDALSGGRLIVGAGAAIAFILGLALAGVQEAKDTSLKNLKDVRAYTNLPVLSSIPLLENTLLVRRKRRIAYLGWSAAIIVGMLAISASLYYHYTSTI